eukprot:5098047-Prymnesium_polylepis.1
MSSFFFPKWSAITPEGTSKRYRVPPLEQDEKQVGLEELQVFDRAVEAEAPYEAVALDEALDLQVAPLGDGRRVEPLLLLGPARNVGRDAAGVVRGAARLVREHS